LKIGLIGDWRGEIEEIKEIKEIEGGNQDEG
jgi:hypothetical protein